MDDLFDYTIKQQAVNILLKLVNNHVLTTQVKIQLFIALYLSIDNSLIHNFQIQQNNQLLQGTIFYRQLEAALVQIIEPDYLDDECCYLALIFSNLYRTYIDDPTLNSHIYIFHQHETKHQAIDELVLTLEYYFDIDRKHPIFQSSIQHFLTFNWMGFPIQLTFYQSAIYLEAYQKVQGIMKKWNDKHQIFDNLINEIVYTLASYLQPLFNLGTINKTVLIVAPSTELHNIYKHTISNYFSNNVITIDNTLYTSINDIPKELITSDTLIVCDKSIKYNERTLKNIASFSLHTLKEDLLRLNQYFQ